MSENPFQAFCQTLDKISKSVQNQLSQFISFNQQHPISSITSNGHHHHHPLLAVSSHSKATLPNPNGDPTSLQPTDIYHKNISLHQWPKKSLDEPLGPSFTFLLLGYFSQYPDKPTRQQKADVKELMAILSRMYPCKECADHFKEVLRGNPVHAGSQAELSQWLCCVHNVVNRSLDKPRFPCERVDARWGKLDCEQRACDLLGDTTFIRNEKY